MAVAAGVNLRYFTRSFRVLRAYLLIVLVTLLSECIHGNTKGELESLKRLRKGDSRRDLRELQQIFILFPSDFQYVTCGSVVKLLNIQHNVRLHSHEVKYGSGSGQQVCLLFALITIFRVYGVRNTATLRDLGLLQILAYYFYIFHGIIKGVLLFSQIFSFIF